MVNKYRRLLMVEAEVGTHTQQQQQVVFIHVLRVMTCTGPNWLPLPSLQRSSPSSEMVMIDRTFNQEERSNLTQDKRMVMVDPGKKKKRLQIVKHNILLHKRFYYTLPLFHICLIDSFLEDFCCGMKSKLFQAPPPSQSSTSCSWNQSDRGSTEPPYRTDFQPEYGDPGGGGAVGTDAADKLHPPHLENKSVLELKRSQQHYGPRSAGSNSLPAANSYPQGNPSPFAATSGGQTHYQVSPHLSSHPVQPPCPPQLTSPPHPDTDSALEAAVNSILEC